MLKFKYHEVGIRVFNLIIKGEYIYETLRKHFKNTHTENKIITNPWICDKLVSYKMIEDIRKEEISRFKHTKIC